MIKDVHRKPTQALILLCVFCAGLALVPPRGAALVKVGFLVVTHDHVRLKHPDQEEFKVIVQGKREWLLCGDVLQTMSKGTADLSIEPSTRLTVLPETVFTVRCKEGENQILIEVLRGSVQGSVQQGEGLVTTVAGPLATLSTRGATFLNRVDNANHSFVRVFQGQVVVTLINGSTVTLSEKQAVELVAGSKPDLFTVKVLEGAPDQPVKIGVIPGVDVLVGPTDSVGIEKQLKGADQVEIRLVAPAENKADVVVAAGELRRNLAPADSAVLTFRQRPIFILGVEPDTAPPPRDLYDPFRDPEDFRDIADLGFFSDDELLRLLRGPVPQPPPGSPTK